MTGVVANETAIAEARGLQRFNVLKEMVVEDAKKPSAGDEELKHLVKRFTNEFYAPQCAIWLLEEFKKEKVSEQKLPDTFRVIYEALIEGFVETKNEEFREKIAETLRSLPESSEDILGTVLRKGLEKCYDASMLGNFVAGSSKESNRTVLTKIMQRRAATVGSYGGKDLLLFEARCGKIVGPRLSLIEGACLASMRQAAKTAEAVRLLHFHGAPGYLDVRMPAVDQLLFIWQMAPHQDDVQKTIEDAAVWMNKVAEEIRPKLGYRGPKRPYGVKLEWHILPREYGWEHKRNELEPLHVVSRDF